MQRMALPVHNATMPKRRVRLAIVCIAITLLLAGLASLALPDKALASRFKPQESNKEVAELATFLLGRPYVIGGETLEGFDDSGFTMYCYREVYGVQLPHNAQLQYAEGEPLALRDVAPGDLIFFGKDEVTIKHVGISIGGNAIIHAPKPGEKVKYSTFEECYKDYGSYVCACRPIVPHNTSDSDSEPGSLTHIDQVNLVVSEPKTGENPDFTSWTVETKPADALTNLRVDWHRLDDSSTDTWVALSSDDTFTANVTSSVTLVADFADGFTGDKDTVLTVNGKPADQERSKIEEGSPNLLDAYRWQTPVDVDSDSNGATYIREIDVAVTAPEPGEHPDFTTPTYVTVPDMEFLKVRIEWRCVKNYERRMAQAMTAQQVFEPGQIYLAAITAYYDTTKYIVSSDIVLKVNGEPADSHLSDIRDDFFGIAGVWRLPDGPLELDDEGESEASNSNTGSSIPSTGDSSMSAAFLIALLAAAGMCIVATRRIACK